MVSQRQVRDLLHYSPWTGELTWRPRIGNPQWNGRWAGRQAGYVHEKMGYRFIRVGGGAYLAHRIIWLYMYGWMPNEVDHEDHVKDNNRLSNLRAADRSINSQNHTLQTNNTSGHVGVHWYRRVGRWTAYIANGRRRVNLGYFETRDAAIDARRLASDRYGYHKNHGAAKAA